MSPRRHARPAAPLRSADPPGRPFVTSLPDEFSPQSAQRLCETGIVAVSVSSS
jgi:hypothetical protein